MTRTYVDLDNVDTARLDSFAHDFHLSRPALVGFVIQKWLAAQSHNNKKSAFGLLKGKIGDGLEYQRNIRNEWLDEARCEDRL